MTPEPAPTVMDMEARIAADSSGQYRAELQAKLQGELATLKRQLAAGMAPGDFTVANQLKEALEAADSVVARAWEREHGSAR